MWLSGQQKRPADYSEGQTGIVTMSGGETAVMLDSERRGVEVYSPGGYRWTPRRGQRVLVIQGRGEVPCIVGARQGSGDPDRVTIRAGSVSVGGTSVSLQGEVSINGESLEQYIIRVVAALLSGTGGGT